jgi:hypothetical protein
MFNIFSTKLRGNSYKVNMKPVWSWVLHPGILLLEGWFNFQYSHLPLTVVHSKYKGNMVCTHAPCVNEWIPRGVHEWIVTVWVPVTLTHEDLLKPAFYPGICLQEGATLSSVVILVMYFIILPSLFIILNYSSVSRKFVSIVFLFLSRHPHI